MIVIILPFTTYSAGIFPRVLFSPRIEVIVVAPFRIFNSLAAIVHIFSLLKLWIFYKKDQ